MERIMRVTSFTQEELEELRRIDAELDAAPLTLEDYEAQALVDELLFPERAKQKAKEAERRRAYYEANRDTINARSRVWHEENREHDAERKRTWYQKNKARIAAQQKAYRDRNKEKIAEQQRKSRERRKAVAATA